MAQALGQLPNAPLIYVLAQVVFTRVPKMADIWEDFHQKIFDRYPESQIEQIEQFTITESVEPSRMTRWHMLSREKNKGIILHSNMLILHTTSYTTSRDFFNDLEFVLAKFVEIISNLGIQTSRLGLRYIDLLLPQHDLAINKQVSEKLGMFDLSKIGCKSTQFDRVEKYTTEIGGELVLKHRQTSGTDLLPNDLFPNFLEPAPLLEQQKQNDWTVGFLDFDHFLKVELSMEPQMIIDKFRALHKTLSSTFREVTTPAAKERWKERSL